MNVEKLIHDYRIADKVRDGGINFLKEHITKTYVPYMQKMSRCELLVNSCWYRTDTETGVKRFAVNSPNLRVMFRMQLVRQYTDIELNYDGTKIVEDYDKLRQSGILISIFSLIPKSEFDQFESVLEMTQHDVMTNEYEIGAYIRNRLNDGLTIVGNLITPALVNAGFTKEDLTALLSSSEVKNFISALNGNKE